jgi:hypothetical protein
MILVFADDSTMRAVDDISDANRYCEVVDVETGVYTFIDEHAALFRPILAEPTRRTVFGCLCSADSFSLAATDERRPELLRSIFDGTVCVEPGPRIRTREDLIRELEICTR